VIKIRYSSDLRPGLNGHAESHGRSIVIHLLPGLTQAQRQAALRRLRHEGRMGIGPRLPSGPLVLALLADRMRTAFEQARAILRLHPAGSTLPLMAISAAVAAFLVLSPVSIRIVRVPQAADGSSRYIVPDATGQPGGGPGAAPGGAEPGSGAGRSLRHAGSGGTDSAGQGTGSGGTGPGGTGPGGTGSGRTGSGRTGSGGTGSGGTGSGGTGSGRTGSGGTGTGTGGTTLTSTAATAPPSTPPASGTSTVPTPVASTTPAPAPTPTPTSAPSSGSSSGGTCLIVGSLGICLEL
jgi:hypothetical protein